MAPGPKLPLSVVFNRAMDLIDEQVALFFIRGDVMRVKATSKQYENNLVKLHDCLVGVYDQGADARDVLADIQTFYH